MQRDPLPETFSSIQLGNSYQHAASFHEADAFTATVDSDHLQLFMFTFFVY